MTTTLPKLPPGPVTPEFKASIEKALAEMLPKTTNGAVLAVLDENGARAVYATRLGERWELGVSADREWGGNISGEIRVRGTW
jgi:hypothetical protein